MDKYLLPEDDGLSARTFGKWTTVKLDYLQRYIDLIETSMRSKPWCARCYIDLFSGTGKFQVENQSGYYLRTFYLIRFYTTGRTAAGIFHLPRLCS